MLGKRLINSNTAAAGGSCTTDTLQILGDTSCIAYYKMSDATDESGSYDGTPTSVNFNVSGKFGNAGEFNGSSSAIRLPDNSLNSLTSYTVSAWINSVSDQNNQAIVNNWGYANGNAERGWQIRKMTGNVIMVSNYNGGATQTFNSTGSVSLNTWTNVTVTNTQSQVKIYINGTLDSTHSTGGFSPNASYPMRPHIGAYQYSAATYGFFDGSIDQVRIFNKALTSTEVTTLKDEVYCQPTIVPTDYFEPVIYTGDGASARSITSLNFQPDLVWVKSRDHTRWHNLIDSVRGVSRSLYSNSANAEALNDTTGTVSSFNLDGFTVSIGSLNLDDVNKNGENYVAWNWKAGGAAVLNEEGTIDSQVSANVDAGFSIVKFTGSLTSGQTVGHGLTEPPSVVILKDLDSVANWYIYHKGTGTTSGYINHLRFDATAGDYSDKIFYPINFNASTFTPGNDETVLQGSVIAYCFHSVDGYSKIGSYTGTGASGNSIVTGFRPAFVMIKQSSNVGTDNHWNMWDNKRVEYDMLRANTSDSEFAGNLNRITFSSNGFQMEDNDTSRNVSGATYIFMAFAEEVFVPDNFFNDDSTVATYKLNGDAGDDSGNGNNGTPSNVTYAAGKFDDAAVFNGTSSKIDISATNSTPVDFSNETFTISAWINGSGFTTDDRTIISKYSGSNNTTSSFFFDVRDNDQKLRVSEVNGTSVLGLQSAAAIPENTWTHVVYVRTATTCEFFINGASSGGSQSRTTPINQGGTTDISIGEREATKRWIGKIDQVRIFNRTLDSGEVTQLYNE